MMEPELDDDDDRDVLSCPWPERVEYRPVPGFPPDRFRIGDDRSLWRNTTRAGVPPPWNKPQWRRLKPRGAGRFVELRHAGRVDRRSIDRVFRDVFLRPGPIVSPAGDGETIGQAAAPVAELVNGLADRPAAAPVAELVNGLADRPAAAPVAELVNGLADRPAAESRPLPGFPGYAVDSDRAVWRRGGRFGLATVSAWYRLPARIRPRAVNPTVVLYRDGRKYLRRVIDLYRLAFAPVLPSGSPCPAEGFRGIANGRARLNDSTVAEARRLKRAGSTYPELAERFGVSKATLFYAVSGRTWAHVPLEPEIPAQRAP
jgi:hypothetical protein